MIQKTSDFERATGSVALDSISFGQLGGIATIFAIYRLITNKLNPKNKIVCIVFAILGFYILLRSGSRGPLVALIAVLIFFYGFRTKNIRLNFMRIIFILGLLIIFSGLLIQILNFISPLSVSRIVEGVQGNDLSIINRQESYNWFISQIKENIIFGSQFARLSNTNYPGYAHNIFLDILLGFGIFGLLLFLYIIVKTINTLIIMIINHNDKYWIGLLMLYYFITSLFSGTYYSNPVLNLTILLTLLIGANYNNKLHGQKKAQTITIN
ncbi:hypothetical protein AGMMS49574_19540 [Bacteroidia bacterium]|nr:hypothetical protein AGMMS49574_19540 [Bacteroidia bacterium]